MNVEKMSETYLVRKLTSADTDEVFALCEENPLYYEYRPPFVTKSGIEEDMRALPPGKSECDKYYVGFSDDSGLIAVADVIAAYPNEQTAFIGFFMLHVAYQGKGTGTAMISRVCAYLKQAGFRRVQLGFDKENPQSSHFWLKNRFAAVREVPQEKGIIVLAERSL